jgi:hypothetical protein
LRDVPLAVFCGSIATTDMSSSMGEEGEPSTGGSRRRLREEPAEPEKERETRRPRIASPELPAAAQLVTAWTRAVERAQPHMRSPDSAEDVALGARLFVAFEATEITAAWLEANLYQNSCSLARLLAWLKDNGTREGVQAAVRTYLRSSLYLALDKGVNFSEQTTVNTFHGELATRGLFRAVTGETSTLLTVDDEIIAAVAARRQRHRTERREQFRARRRARGGGRAVPGEEGTGEAAGAAAVAAVPLFRTRRRSSVPARMFGPA